jgi:hypothetical protein
MKYNGQEKNGRKHHILLDEWRPGWKQHLFADKGYEGKAAFLIIFLYRFLLT